MANYTVQLFSESGNWANPEPTDVRHASSLDTVYSIFQDWIDLNDRYNDPQDASAMVWKGHEDDVTDLYPDWHLEVGPKGGIRRNPT